ncbi:type II toxin-antitoxin system RelE/ParE family toxin [uncultured Corynebacterium sp.]|uniref:type II toxin-antitoxin system RelE family toxin n=1 Tax=uncultured Corynebacterium sp. TaxID=159447 RepID=UPI00344FDA65
MLRTYTVLFTREAKKQMKRLAKSNPAIFQKVKNSIASLTEDPRPNGVKKLKGHSDAYRIRVGEYRVLYTITDSKVTIEIFRVSTRQEAY